MKFRRGLVDHLWLRPRSRIDQVLQSINFAVVVCRLNALLHPVQEETVLLDRGPVLPKHSIIRTDEPVVALDEVLVSLVFFQKAQSDFASCFAESVIICDSLFCCFPYSPD